MLIYTAKSSEFHPYGTILSSHAMDDIEIQQPLPVESYSWSDFPTICQKESQLISLVTKPKHSTRNVTHEDSMFFSSKCPPSPLLENNNEVGKTPVIENNSNSTINSSVNSDISSKKRVQFAPFPEVRIYSIVLGEHPQCVDGLAIELGWEYSDVESHSDLKYSSKISKEIQCATYPETSPRVCCPRRPYLTRKKLLLDVAGYTEEALNQRIQDAKMASTERSKSEREDYYYHLAFAKR